MLDSLGNEQTVIGLLIPLIPDTMSPSNPIQNVEQKNSTLIQLIDVMMKYILAYMDKKIDESKNQPIESGTSGSSTFSNQWMSPEIISLFRDFLILLYKHIFANFAIKTELTNNQQIFLREHLETILPGCLECLEKIKFLALTNPEKLHLINDLNFPNAIIPLVTHGLLLFPLHQLSYLIDPITKLCLQLSRTVETIPDICMLCESQEAQWSIGEISHPLLVSPLPLSTEFPTEWCWLVDTHRACGCLLGMLLNLQLASIPVDPVEAIVGDWSNSVLFANGLQDNYREGLIQWKESTNEILPSLPSNADQIVECVLTYESAVDSYDIPEPDSVAKLIIDLAQARTEENHSCYEAYNQLIQFATLGEWDTYTDDDVIGLREVSCGMLAVIAKHCRIQIIANKHGAKTSESLLEAYESIFRVRKELFSLRPLDTSEEDTVSSEKSYTQLCATLRAMCLFLIFMVSPAVHKDVQDDVTTNVRNMINSASFVWNEAWDLLPFYHLTPGACSEVKSISMVYESLSSYGEVSYHIPPSEQCYSIPPFWKVHLYGTRNSLNEFSFRFQKFPVSRGPVCEVTP
ncbi:hypothetical protein LOD99_15358 [Oopsacas minuta]|uniref:Uncharacterized protein n=1 Tax=Oopsacas minuta TaxID=111878 RepID=A0AAV7KBK3_9METZ|nr:hypothetical protein LOD99_15358 [Oopsacas minuta]